MLHIRSLKDKINRIHGRALRVAHNSYNGKSSFFQDFLDKENSVTIHHINIRTLATKHTTRAFPTSFE